MPGGLGGMVPAPPTHQMQGLSLHSGAGGQQQQQQQWYNQQQMYSNHQSKWKIANFIAITKANVYVLSNLLGKYVHTLESTPNLCFLSEVLAISTG